jgi:hypothetical protein
MSTNELKTDLSQYVRKTAILASQRIGKCRYWFKPTARHDLAGYKKSPATLAEKEFVVRNADAVMELAKGLATAIAGLSELFFVEEFLATCSTSKCLQHSRSYGSSAS